MVVVTYQGAPGDGDLENREKGEIYDQLSYVSQLGYTYDCEKHERREIYGQLRCIQ
jgi:hypothetical protein